MMRQSKNMITSNVLVVFAVSTVVVVKSKVWAGVEPRHPLVGEYVPDDGEYDESAVEGERDPLDHRLPRVDTPVVQNEQTHKQPGQGATQVAHEPSPVAAVSEIPDVDG